MRLLVISLLHLVYLSNCQDKLSVKYTWKTLDYDFPTEQAREEAIKSKEYIPENNLPMGLEVYGDRLFITVPRWKFGIPSSLNYINLKNDTEPSPKLKPYPNWEAHSTKDNKTREIISPFRVRADKCGRLWVLDSGKNGRLEENGTKTLPSIFIYNLTDDSLIRKYQLPAENVKPDSGFANIVIEVISCDNTYAYAADTSSAGIVGYSLKDNTSWRVSHHHFNFDPLACDYSINGYNFTWDDALFGLGISKPNDKGFSTIYFHPMSSFYEFSISTEYLRDATTLDKNFDKSNIIGKRGPKSQSAVSFFDQEKNILFYSLVNFNAVACWDTNKVYKNSNQGIFMNNKTITYISDIKVDYTGNIWVFSNILPMWMKNGLDANVNNFNILTAPVTGLIEGTPCGPVKSNTMHPASRTTAKKSASHSVSSFVLVTLTLMSFVALT